MDWGKFGNVTFERRLTALVGVTAAGMLCLDLWMSTAQAAPQPPYDINGGWSGSYEIQGGTSGDAGAILGTTQKRKFAGSVILEGTTNCAFTGARSGSDKVNGKFLQCLDGSSATFKGTLTRASNSIQGTFNGKRGRKKFRGSLTITKVVL